MYKQRRRSRPESRRASFRSGPESGRASFRSGPESRTNESGKWRGKL